MNNERKEKIDMVMYDMEELINESIKDQDLWSRHMPFSPYFSQINAVSNMTKFAVSYRKKLTVYDVWKDRDYEDCPDESEYTPLEMELGHNMVPSDYIPDLATSDSDTDSDEDDNEYHPHDHMSSPSSIESDNEEIMNE